MTYTIKDLAEGRCAVINDGTFVELRRVLSEAFPNDLSALSACAEYYFRGEYKNNMWYSSFSNISLPAQSVKEFIKQLDMKKLPKNWKIKVNGDNFAYLKKWLESNPSVDPIFHNPHGWVLSDLMYDKSHQSYAENPFGYTEITTEQFKQHFMKEKEIIGYKLIKNKYKKAVEKLTDLYNAAANPTLFYSDHANAILKLKEACVLELWFEPVFKEEKQLPKINGYDGKVDRDFIIYGNDCARFHKQFFKNIEGINVGNNWGNRKVASIKLDSGVEITMEQVKQIVEYIKDKE